MEIMQAIQKFREEFRIKQVDLNDNLVSPSRYSRLERGMQHPTFEEILFFSEELGVRLPELLFHAHLSQAKDYKYLSKKEQALAFLSNDYQEDFTRFFDTAFDERLVNVQYYSIYVLYLYVAKSIHFAELPTDKKLLKDIKKFFGNREFFSAADYEILGNLTLFFNMNEISFVFDHLFPVTESGGHIRDTYVQHALKNGVTASIQQYNFSTAKHLLAEFQSLKQIKEIELGGYIDLEMLYLKHLCNFVEKKEIDDYIEATKIINLFKELGQDDYYKAMMKELSEVAKDHDFKIRIPDFTMKEINDSRRLF